MRQGLAFLFPGQGSQRAGMLAEAAAEFSQVSDTFEEGSEALGEDLWAMIERGDDSELNLTENTQPLLLTSSVALWRCWIAGGGAEPSGMAGHSLGEISALCCADAIDFTDAVRLVRARGRFMQSAVPAGKGAMAAILGLSPDEVVAVCADVARSTDGVVAAVNFNSPQQVVIAGHRETVDAAAAKLADAGARRAVALPVSAPFHTELMKPAGERLAGVLNEIAVRRPRIQVMHNVTAAPESDPGRIRELLVTQVSAPVRWTDCVHSLAAAGARHFVECGPGRVLGGLQRRIDRSIGCDYLEAPKDLRAALEASRQGVDE